jgi:hypothetical protein
MCGWSHAAYYSVGGKHAKSLSNCGIMPQQQAAAAAAAVL